ncbi:MAG: hypothetical protein K0S47_3160 [Herbinix sp.]|jgi:hypothetical protein|nr:hypothetical protein [Herbinix sp.]
MKIGDKVKVIALEKVDTDETNIQVGWTGTIKNTHWANDGSNDDVFGITFNETLTTSNPCSNLNHCGTYDMCREQLELADSVEGKP